MNSGSKIVKKNPIWSDVLIEANLCESVNAKFATLDEPKQDPNMKLDRSIESYAYTQKPVKTTPPVSASHKNHLSSIDYNRAKLAVEANLVKPASKPLDERIGPLVQFDETKSRDHILANELDSEELVTKEIVKHLNEPKSDLIKRVVNVLGRKKALELLYATEDIQSSGGMLTTVSIIG